MIFSRVNGPLPALESFCVYKDLLLKRNGSKIGRPIIKVKDMHRSCTRLLLLAVG